MPCVVELHLDVVVEHEVVVVVHRDEEVHAGAGVFLGVDGFKGGQPLLAAFLVEPFHIVLLDETAVREHDVAKVLRGIGADHRPSETQFIEIRYQSAVVDVCVGEDDIVDFLGVDHDVAVHGIGLKPLALEHAAVQQDFLAVVGGNQVLTARHLLGCTDEFDFHRLKFAPKLVKKSEVAMFCHLTS